MPSKILVSYNHLCPPILATCLLHAKLFSSTNSLNRREVMRETVVLLPSFPRFVCLLFPFGVWCARLLVRTSALCYPLFSFYFLFSIQGLIT